MNGNLFFSIIVPVYNVMDYLEECMSSLLSQNMENYEIVLVDDGSTDGSSDLCDSFAEDNPAVVRVFHQDNKGLLRTRRVGISEARGEVLLFVDSDDVLREDALHVLCESFRDTGADIVFFEMSRLVDVAIPQPLPTPYVLVSQYFTVPGFFVSSFFGLGTIGVALMSGMYGLIGGISCKSMRCEQTVRNAVLYAIVLQIPTLSFFANTLLFRPNVFQLVIVFLVFRKSRTPSSGGVSLRKEHLAVKLHDPYACVTQGCRR